MGEELAIRATFESVPRGLNYQSISLFFYRAAELSLSWENEIEENGESLPGILLRRGAKLSELIRAILHANTSPCSQRDVGAEHREFKVIKPRFPSIITPLERKRESE